MTKSTHARKTVKRIFAACSSNATSIKILKFNAVTKEAMTKSMSRAMQLVHTGYMSIRSGSEKFFYHETKQIRFSMLRRGLVFATLTRYLERKDRGSAYIGVHSLTAVSRLGTEITIDVKWPDPPVVENLTAVSFYIGCAPETSVTARYFIFSV